MADKLERLERDATPGPWNELLEAAGDVLADALPPHGIGHAMPTCLSPAIQRLAEAVEAIDPSERSYPP